MRMHSNDVISAMGSTGVVVVVLLPQLLFLTWCLVSCVRLTLWFPRDSII